ncbi:MAG: class I SAM-dependent methyltransferase [Bacteroidales bacterium]|nr:class I SAM-dependent methyltransferase [Bacteroidales bacterium]
MHLKFRLGLTAFGHIGVFPEQAENWKFIYDTIKLAVGSKQLAVNTGDSEPDPVIQSSSDPVIQSSSDPVIQSSSDPVIQSSSDPVIQHPVSGIRVLNLFAYTGGASLAAKAAGADVVHVDSVKQVINWAREDMEVSNLEGIRWVIEDALKFVRREVKRGNKYDGIILDPPAYGRGPDGEKWILEDSINEMISMCAELLSGQSAVGSSQWAIDNPQSPVTSHQSPFFILSLYSMGFSSLIGESLVKSHFGTEREIQTGEFYFTDRAGRNLPLGTVTRFC